ncbi:MAG: protein translocase subunit SecF [Candidatus Methanoperedens sp.]|jgi:preprotein translocase subunit SecF|nr:protein translocase subunit SecF [Candidatus Methanoperedens sp.]PKL53571.1 MAG: preprotein translocase subunit SecF [Candidatus Methanoperedenaceae archaeon HGW-Methanoperedenaceae-1]
MNLINEKAIDNYIEKFSFKKMLVIPVLLFIISLSILAYMQITTGAPVELGVEFSGGTAITFDSAKTPQQLKTEFQDYNIVQAREYGGTERKLIQFGPMSESLQNEVTRKINSEYANVEIRQMGEVVSKSLQGQALLALVYSFLGMAIVVFLIFKTFVPSIAVVTAALADIVFAVAMMNVFGVVLSLGTVAALLMLIGYSVDTDILLTNRLLKRRGELNEKVKDAMKTGLTMTITTLAALAALFIISSGSYIVSSFTRIDIIRDISAVLIFGLVGDLVNTWMTNLGILRWFLEKDRKVEKRTQKTKRGKTA